MQTGDGTDAPSAYSEQTLCELICTFFQACCFLPLEAITSNEVPGLPTSKCLHRMTNRLQVQPAPCCLSLPSLAPSACLLQRCVCVGRCGLCPLVTLVQQTSPARQLQLHPLQAHAASSVNHAYAACKSSPAIDKPRAFIGKQTLFLL